MNYCATATAIALAKEKETDGEEDAEMKSSAVINRLGSVRLFSREPAKMLTVDDYMEVWIMNVGGPLWRRDET